MYLLVRRLCYIESDNTSMYTSYNSHKIVFTPTIVDGNGSYGNGKGDKIGHYSHNIALFFKSLRIVV